MGIVTCPHWCSTMCFLANRPFRHIHNTPLQNIPTTIGKHKAQCSCPWNTPMWRGNPRCTNTPGPQSHSLQCAASWRGLNTTEVWHGRYYEIVNRKKCVKGVTNKIVLTQVITFLSYKKCIDVECQVPNGILGPGIRQFLPERQFRWQCAEISFVRGPRCGRREWGGT